jgi:hypothetical protein
MRAAASTTPDAAPPLAAVAPEALADAWTSAREESALACTAWCGAAVAERRAAFAVYLAAADREDAAQEAFLSATAGTARDLGGGR